MKEGLFFLCFITLLVVFYLIILMSISKQKSILRLKKYAGDKNYYEKKRKTEFKPKNFLNIFSKTIKEMKFLDSYRDKIQVDIIKAHIPLKAEEFISLRIYLTLGLIILTYLTGKHVAVIILLGACGWLLPKLFVNVRIHKRIKQFNDSLGDAIILISNSLKAGYSFFQSIDIVAKEMNGPIAQEFALLQKEINLGYTTEDALDNLVKRIKSDDLELVITAVLIQRQVGGNLAEVLDSISSTIRERIRIKGEIRTITAQGRISGVMIAILPPALGVVLYLINPDHIKLLFTEKIGLIMIGLSVGMELMGIYFIKRIVKIEV